MVEGVAHLFCTPFSFLRLNSQSLSLLPPCHRRLAQASKVDKSFPSRRKFRERAASVAPISEVMSMWKETVNESRGGGGGLGGGGSGFGASGSLFQPDPLDSSHRHLSPSELAAMSPDERAAHARRMWRRTIQRQIHQNKIRRGGSHRRGGPSASIPDTIQEEA